MDSLAGGLRSGTLGGGESVKCRWCTERALPESPTKTITVNGIMLIGILFPFGPWRRGREAAPTDLGTFWTVPSSDPHAATSPAFGYILASASRSPLLTPFLCPIGMPGGLVS